MIGNCSSCHEGTISTGKSAIHINSSDTCDDCHNSSAWSPVAQMDHGSVIGNCNSCHDRTISTGQYTIDIN